MERTDHDKKMDALARRIAGVCEGENGFDVAVACMVVATFSLVHSYETRPEYEQGFRRMSSFLHRMRDRFADERWTEHGQLHS